MGCHSVIGARDPSVSYRQNYFGEGTNGSFFLERSGAAGLSCRGAGRRLLTEAGIASWWAAGVLDKTKQTEGLSRVTGLGSITLIVEERRRRKRGTGGRENEACFWCVACQCSVRCCSCSNGGANEATERRRRRRRVRRTGNKQAADLEGTHNGNDTSILKRSKFRVRELRRMKAFDR